MGLAMNDFARRSARHLLARAEQRLTEMELVDEIDLRELWAVHTLLTEIAQVYWQHVADTQTWEGDQVGDGQG